MVEQVPLGGVIVEQVTVDDEIEDPLSGEILTVDVQSEDPDLRTPPIAASGPEGL